MKFGITHNARVASEIGTQDSFIDNELGGIKSLNNKGFYDVVVFADVEVNDGEIKRLAERLPKFNKAYY